jgi:hypothetical protein
VLQLLTGKRYSKNEQIILDMAKAAPCLTEEDGPYKPCSAICPYLPDFSKLFRFEKREPVLQIGTPEEDVNRTNANAKNPPKTRYMIHRLLEGFDLILFPYSSEPMYFLDIGLYMLSLKAYVKKRILF